MRPYRLPYAARLALGLALSAAAAGAAPPDARPAVASGGSASLVGREWEHVPTSRKVVALTFDAGGPSAAGLGRILRTLRAEGVAAHFFLSAGWIRRYPGEARAIAVDHPLANHTDSHPQLTRMPDGSVRREVQAGEEAIVRITGSAGRPLFRFPYGDRDRRTMRLIGSLGYGSVYWTADTHGWMGRSKISAGGVVQRVVSRLRPGAIVLLHVGAARDGSTLDVDALPAMIAAIRSRGYDFVALDEFVGKPVRLADDGTPAHFSASGEWKRKRGGGYNGAFSVARPDAAGDPARLRARVPGRGRYAVYARWPALPGNNAATLVGVETRTGVRWRRVDQRRNGGRWFHLGSHEFDAGDQWVLRVSRASSHRGDVLADAVKLVKR